MFSPLPASDAGDVQAQERQGADHDHSGDSVDPRSHERGQKCRRRSRAEIEPELDGDACHHDVKRLANGEYDALQRASFRWGRVLPPPQTPCAELLSSTAGSADALLRILVG